MAQINVSWEKGGFYIIASRIPFRMPFTGVPYLSFFACENEDGSKGTWITVDTVSEWHANAFPSAELPAFPWPDAEGRVPHVVARLATDRPAMGTDRPWDEHVFTAALYRAWLAGRRVEDVNVLPGPSNVHWFLNAIRQLNEARFLMHPDAKDARSRTPLDERTRVDAAALLEMVRGAATQPMQGAQVPVILDISHLCVQGPGPTSFDDNWGFDSSRGCTIL